MSSGEGRKVSADEIQLVQNLIEQCLPHYMTQKEVIDILYTQEKIEPSFTELVWQKLEEQNQEFFKAYHLRLMVKEQITEFNKLLTRQVTLMQQMSSTGVGYQPMPNGSHLSAMNTPSYVPESTGMLLKENMQLPSNTNIPSGFANFGSSIHPGMQHTIDMSVPSNMMLAQNSNVGMVQGTNGVPIKTEAGYLGGSRFVYGANGNVLEAHPAMADTSVSSFGSLESDPHQLNGTLLDDPPPFGLLEQMSQNFSLSDLTAITNSDMLESYTRSAFLPSARENFLDSHGSSAEHQGENKRLDAISENLHFKDFGGNS